MLKLAYILSVSIVLSYIPIAFADGSSFDHFSTERHPNALPLIGIRINSGAKYTNKKSIEVEVKSIKTDKSLLELMKI